MTNAHYHCGGVTLLSSREKTIRFYGVHPWNAETVRMEEFIPSLRAMLDAEPHAGVGEIGLDRLKTRVVTAAQREVFLSQLEVAAELHRPVVLHGAKCWGEVVKAVKPFADRIPAFLFHGFSRSDGLVPDIVAVNGFISVGKSVLNDHAVNYRALVKKLPLDHLLIETDDDAADEQARTEALSAVFSKTSELTGLTEAQLDANASSFLSPMCLPADC